MTQNPSLRGFNPDPSIVRVGDDFYIATSTFEWYPGVQIHHSRDLRHWQLVGRPLDRPDLLNMLGCPDSCGVWAPCLTYADGLFWLAYADVRRFDGNFKDTHNYVTTAPAITGPWSDPVYLNSSGFDPSFYHAEDGRKWFLNMVWDHRPDRGFFAGIVMQEYDVERGMLVGEITPIFEGTELGLTEGPHIQRHGDWYYLITAEGGTGYGHAMTIARSRSLHGPYEADPDGPLFTARDDPDWPLQRSGHGDIAELEDGSYVAAYLCSRLFGESRHSPLGRETAIQSIELSDDGWFRPTNGSALPALEADLPELAEAIVEPEIELDDFSADTLNPVYQWLRSPWPDELFSLGERPGHLRIYGMESPGSLFRQSLVARRQKHFRFTAETRVDVEPQNFQQMAGLIVYYNSSKFHYLYVGFDDGIGKHLGIMSCEADRTLAASFPMHDQRVALPEGPVSLKAEADHEALTFSYRTGSNDWACLPPTLDMRHLTDQAGLEAGEQFTGTFVGMCANDLSGQRLPADFEYFSYKGSD